MSVHVGCYVKCKFEKIKTTRNVQGCPEHGRSVKHDLLFEYCYRCGRKLYGVDEAYYGFPHLYEIIGNHSNLGSVLVGGELYMVSSVYSDGTNFSNNDNEIVLDMAVMANAMLKFHRLYAVELEKLRNYGSIEVHFGVLFLDEA